MYEYEGYDNNYDFDKLDESFMFHDNDLNSYYQPPTPDMPNDKKEKKPKKSGGSGNKFLAAVIITVLGGSSLGVGLGIGNGVYNQFIGGSKPAVVEAKPAAPSAPALKFDSLAISEQDMTAVTVIKEVSNSVVSINVSMTVTDIFNRAYSESGAGSGVIFSEDEDYIYIVTNYHVIKNAQAVTISIDDTTSVEASSLGSDEQSDMAVIKVERAKLIAAGITDYKVAAFGDAEAMEIGDTVIAIGNALGEGKSATQGIVSAKDKQIAVEVDKTLDVIQTDAAINAGNSGGALVNLNGQVIGINTAKLSGSGVEGMGYAIPSNTVKEIVESILEIGTVERPYIGIAGVTIDEKMKETYSLPSLGVYVAKVSAGSGAQEAFLIAGDIIVKFDGADVTTMEALQEQISKMQIGETVKLSVYRDNELKDFTIVIKDSNANKSF